LLFFITNKFYGAIKTGKEKEEIRFQFFLPLKTRSNEMRKNPDDDHRH
jgi:hypothetical protein